MGYRRFSFVFLCQAISLLLLLGVVAPAMGHGDMDLAITSIHMDKQCRAHVLIKNVGRSLPKSFYKEDQSAYISIRKGSEQETLPLLVVADINQQLQDKGGVLALQSQGAFADNPAHFEVEFHSSGEFMDHNAQNNILRKSIDCEADVGEVAGRPVVFTRPDVAIEHAWVDRDCQLQLRVINETEIAMPESAWEDPQNAVQIKLFNNDTHLPIQSIALQTVDPARDFTTRGHRAEWRTPLVTTSARHIKISIWYVPDDLYFPNNEVVVDVPKVCQKPK